MRKMFMAILALAGASSLLVPLRVLAQDVGVQQEMRSDLRAVTRAARLRTSQDGAPGNDPDTVWIGHVYDAAFTAGGKMQAGGYGPYRVGRGANFPKSAGGTNYLTGKNIGDNGTWDFDRFQGASAGHPEAENDSLQGWWPVARAYQSGATTFGDFRYAFMGLDYGNQVNYVINQGGPKRTFGIVGLWHRDKGNTAFAPSDTVAGSNVQPVLWSPTEVGGAGSTASAWMGMRSHGDVSHQDAVANGGTGNYFNSDLLQYQGNNGHNQAGSTSALGTDHNFPGYGSQMDQMLYRDVNLAEGDGLIIQFNYSTNMSRETNTTTGARIGWFDKDPISNAQVGVGSGAVPSNDGNFISSFQAGDNAPCDSFMVYVGAPVNDANVTFSAPLFVGVNQITTVYDPKRRWFSEVLRCVTGDNHYKEILSTAGVHAAALVTCNFGALYPTVLQDIKDANGLGGGGVARIVFRVKTGRGFDDENGSRVPASTAFNSTTRGAAIVDNVVVNSWAAANGDFEAANSIDNSQSGGSALTAWRSTGKPPAVYFHVHSVFPGAGLVFNDPCGSVDNANRFCNLYGNVATSGDHDAAEKDGGVFGSNTQDRQRWLVSPTVNLKASGNGPGNYNAMGIDDEIATTSGDYRTLFSLYNAGFVNATTETGNFLSVGYQSYPTRQNNGNICWGEARHTAAISFYGSPQGCFETFFTGAKANSLIRTTNAANKPDSLRIYIHRISRCYSFTGLSAADCSPTVGDRTGTYFDNISLELRDGLAPPGIAMSIWHLINDAFPTNATASLIPAGFDTCAAQVRIGLNNAAQTGDTDRPAITGDTLVVVAGGQNQRLDMVFRILPGPGNYMTKGVKSSGVARRPDGKVGTSQTFTGLVLATSGDGTFFGTYMANTGEFGSQANHIGQGPGGTNWSQQIWNSARMDTSEFNLFPTSDNSTVVRLTPGEWQGSYHESDPKFTTLGVSKNRCYKVVPRGQNNSDNIVCYGLMSATTYTTSSGWDGTQTTKEYSKIIPDGLLTPGSHVQYFFRKCDVSTPSVFEIAPDTNLIFQGSEGSTDRHRWQQFGVLPDRWKDGAWSVADRNAAAPACMIFVDWGDRRGDEGLWVGIADTIGATVGSYSGGLPSGRWGAHNGWHATGNQNITVSVGTDPTIAVYKHGGQPGTIWDMFGVKAAESFTTSSSLGSRSAFQPGLPAVDHQANKQNKNGPTGDMLRGYYRILLALTGDLNAGIVGPFADRSDNDTGLLNDFAATTGGTSKPRGIWFQGDAFVEGQINGEAAAHPAWVKALFNADLAGASYRNYAANTTDIVDVTPHAPLGSGYNNGGGPQNYTVLSNCFVENDALAFDSGALGSVASMTYPDGSAGTNPKIAGIYTPSNGINGSHPSVTLVDGWQLVNMGVGQNLSSIGTAHYYWNVFTNLWGSLNCLITAGQPVGVGENPNQALVNFLALRSENPFRAGAAKITFGITKKEKVELKVYDVAGRLVKTLANREFEAGSHDLFWDGTHDDGRQVARGVYFYQLRTPSFVSQKKLAVLKN